MAAVGPWRATRRGEIADRFVMSAAALAPSVHNTQPWYFTSSRGVLRLYADPSRGLPEEDPAGREMLISCGAALVNLTLAVRHLGFAANVRLLPDVTRRDLLAEVRWGRHEPPAAYEDVLYRSIARRHTHRGPFTVSVPPFVTGELVRIARHEQAELHVIYGTGRYQALADLVRAAELAQRASPGIAAEQARWARPPGDIRRDGVPAGTRHMRWDGPEFTDREFAHGAYARALHADEPRAVGLVALLSTRDDRRPGWLLAGQALQRLLLHATAHGVGAAFHTQPLEVPVTRDQIRAEFTGGAYPQMLLRLGCGGTAVTSLRRPVSRMFRKESA
jgi:hypothetical protein